MRYRKIGWLPLAAALMFASVSAATASAEAPEFGRCVKASAKALSNYDSSKCVKKASEDSGSEAEKLKKGDYEWLSGVIDDEFTTAIKSGTIMTIEEAGGTKWTCTGETSSGEYAGTKEIRDMVVQLTGCETNKLKCASAGEPAGTIDTAPLGGTLGVEAEGSEPAKDHLAMEWREPAGETFAAFECAGLKVVWRGSILHNVAANEMKLTATEGFTASKGKQKPEHFVGGVAGEHILEISTNGSAFEPLGWTLTTILTNGEAVEASSVN